MDYENKSGTKSKTEKDYSKRPNKTCKTGYVVVIYDDEGHIQDTPFASFDRGLAEEVALEYAWELMWMSWYWSYESKLTDFYIYVKEIPWYE